MEEKAIPEHVTKRIKQLLQATPTEFFQSETEFTKITKE
jgi:hypothetical protein